MADYPKHPFLLSIEETAKALGTDVDKGLTTAQVTTAQEKYPLNELDVGGTIPWYKIMTKQVLNAMIIVSVVPNANRLERGISELTECASIGPRFCYGSQFRYQGLHRRGCLGIRHCPQRLNWFLARVPR